MSSVLSRRPAYDEQRERTRRGVLEATGRLLASGKAYAELTVGEISTEAGVSRPTFYAYFQDKRALILALAAEFEHAARAAARPWLEQETEDLPATLRDVLDAFTAHRVTVGAVVEAVTYDPDVAAFWRGFHDWFVGLAIVRARAADPSLGQEEAEALAYSLVWMTERCFTEHQVAPRVSTEALLAAVGRLWGPVSSEPVRRADPVVRAA